MQEDRYPQLGNLQVQDNNAIPDQDPPGFVTSKQAISEAVKYIYEFKEGKMRPLKLRDPHLNDNMLGGIYPKKSIVIAGLSMSGKTYTAQELEEDIFNPILNPPVEGGYSIELIRCNWEMPTEDLFIRRLTREMRVDVDDILLTKGFSEKNQAIFDNAEKCETDPRIKYYSKTVYPKQFYDDMRAFLLRRKNKNIFTIISIDHAALIKKPGGDAKKAIDEFMEYIIELKKEFMVSFVILTQLNRELVKRSRTAKGDQAHEPQRDDIYQSDSMFFLADYCFIIHRPEFIGIEEYMSFKPDKYPNLQKFFIDGWENKHKINPNSKTSFKTEGLIFIHDIKIRTQRVKKRMDRMSVNIMKGYEDMYKDPGEKAEVTTNVKVPEKDLTKDFSQENKAKDLKDKYRKQDTEEDLFKQSTETLPF